MAYRFGTKYDSIWLLMWILSVLFIKITYIEVLQLREKLYEVHPNPHLYSFNDLFSVAYLIIATILIKNV